MIYTSYFGNLRNLPKERVIAISRGVPKGFDGPKAIYLAPPWELIKDMDRTHFTEEYRKRVLARVDPVKLLKNLDNYILLCWEAPGAFCHRRVLADWVKEKTGIEIPEWENPKKETAKAEASENKAESPENGPKQLEFF